MQNTKYSYILILKLINCSTLTESFVFNWIIFKCRDKMSMYDEISRFRRPITIIIKSRLEPFILQGLRAALARINPNNEKLPILKKAYASRSAGYLGEKRVDQVFQNYSFAFKHKIFNGISLTSSTNFQIDSLFITQSYAVIFETKNLAGSIKVKNNPPQLVQTLDNGETRGFASPVCQVQSNIELLQDWFHSRNISLPIYGVVVLAFPKKEVEVIQTEIQFLYPSGIPSYIRKLPTAPQLLDEKSFSSLIKDLLSGDTEYIPRPISSIYSIPKSDLTTGVACPSCSFFGMIKYRAGWRCPVCPEKSSDAHVQAIHDWFLLFGGKMTNKDCREFLKVDQRQTSTRILQSMKLHTEGGKRNRTYAMTLDTK